MRNVKAGGEVHVRLLEDMYERLVMTEFQRILLDHWLKYMPVHPEQIQHSIRTHFESNPWDRDVLRPHVLKAWKDMKGG